MKKSLPFFSIIICTFNRASLLKRALRSLKKQSFQDFEVILVDDGSTDATKNVVKKYKNVKYFFIKKSGLVKSRNFGVSKSTGKYITFLDSDDEYLPKRA
jgi:glycosyltransferase involved in cell wall biosynthesis